ncbi:30S ribosomal protein S11 [Candidatus Peribacteria bacterium]|nr:30S ribosomal protein S11 [Candidatus Peribacteria bacterium]
MADDKKPSSVLEEALAGGDPVIPASAATPGKKKKIKRALPKARVCIHAGENNTIVTFTDLDGKVLGWSSSGAAGFKGTRKSTPYAAKIAAETAASKVKPYGIETVSVEIKGLGPGREQSIRGLQAAGLSIDTIVDVTPIAHGGCRAPGRRRV